MKIEILENEIRVTSGTRIARVIDEYVEYFKKLDRTHQIIFIAKHFGAGPLPIIEVKDKRAPVRNISSIEWTDEDTKVLGDILGPDPCVPLYCP